MKMYMILTSVLYAMLFTGCQENDPLSAKTEQTGTLLEASWELRSSQGGLLPGKIFSPGNGFILKFTQDQFYKYAEGQLEKSGTYSVLQDNFFNTDLIMDRIIYDNDTDFPKTFYQISEDTLILYFAAPLATDGLESVYVRIKNE